MKKKTLHYFIIAITLLVWLAFWQFNDKFFPLLEANYTAFYEQTTIGQWLAGLIGKLPYNSPPGRLSAALTNYVSMFLLSVLVIAAYSFSKKKVKMAALLILAAYVFVAIANVTVKVLGLSEDVVNETRHWFSYLASPLTDVYLVIFFVARDKLMNKPQDNTSSVPEAKSFSDNQQKN